MAQILQKDSEYTTERPARPKKSLGQNFLVDRRILGRILSAAEVSPGDAVLEIGPGRGFMTRELANRGAHIVAVEKDEELAAGLTTRFTDQPNVKIITADAREIDIKSLFPVGTSYKLVANLPYYAASPIIRRFLETTRKPQLMVVMVQKEVAQSMAADPGEMSILSVATQLYGNPRIVTYVPPKAFRPTPKIISAIVRIDVYTTLALTLDSTERFFRLVKAGFTARRKQMRNSLKQGLALSSEASESILAQAKIDPSRRAETSACPNGVAFTRLIAYTML
ncbi:MAG: ribosomal RNA small subunit methyltransferase A, partial [Chloroflexi bacterium]|nr:ribosomal RNA small subunit methyltransferase A [Chloroflexota bacterium]